MTTQNPEAFEAVLLRARTVDGEGNLVNEDASDIEALPASWTLIEKQDAAGVPPQVFVLGTCRLLIISEDASEFAEMGVLPEHHEGGTVRASITMSHADAPPVRGGDFVAVLVSVEAAVIFEVLLDASEIPPLEPGALALVSLAPGETVLHLRADLDLVGDAGLLAQQTQGEA